jgi:RND superfamily putative drug exporter
MTSGLYRFIKTLTRHKFLAASLFIALAAGVVFWAGSLESTLDDNYSLPGTQSQQAADDLAANFPQLAGPSATVVFVATDGSITDQNDQQYVGGVLKQLFAEADIVAVSNPYQLTNGVSSSISQDGTTAIASVNYAEGTAVTPELTERMSSLLDSSNQQAKALGIDVTPGGNTYFITSNVGTDDTSSEALGLIAAVIVMVIAFGSLIAMGVPLLTALSGLGVGISLTYVLANWFSVSSIGPTVATMIGLGVGIDYSLFIVTRYREYLRQNLPVNEAVSRAIATAGQAVIVAGITVVIALLGLLLIDIPIMSSIAFASVITVSVAILTAITLLPALLAIVGKRIEKLNLHRAFKTDGTNERLAKGWGNTITTHPVWWSLAALAVFAVLTIPIFSMQLGPPGEDTVPVDNPQRISYNIITDKFGVGYNGPLLAVSELPTDQSAATNTASLTAIEKAVSQTDGVALVSPPTLSQSGSSAFWTIIPTTAPADPATETLINNLRDTTIPQATASSGISTNIGGQTATFVDMAEQITSRMPIFMAAVIILAFLLLLVAFRSIFIPLLAAAMILLTAGATFGVMVAIFQNGWGGSIIGLDGATGPLVSYVPIMVFAIIFGLSMDYMIFLTSRIKENYLETGKNKPSIIFGLAKSVRVIIAAALIMFSVFASFNTQSNVVIKMFGTGLAVAIVIDVLLARMILVPAIMTLGKKHTWAFPKWLHWIPDMKFEDASVFEEKSKKSKPKK